MNIISHLCWSIIHLKEVLTLDLIIGAYEMKRIVALSLNFAQVELNKGRIKCLSYGPLSTKIEGFKWFLKKYTRPKVRCAPNKCYSLAIQLILGEVNEP